MAKEFDPFLSIVTEKSYSAMTYTPDLCDDDKKQEPFSSYICGEKAKKSYGPYHYDSCTQVVHPGPYLRNQCAMDGPPPGDPGGPVGG